MFLDKLKSGEPAFSCEFFPPKTDAGWQTLARTLSDLRPLGLDFVSVTCGAGGTVRDLTAGLVDRTVNEFGLPTVGHLTCAGSSVAELRERLAAYRASGVSAVMALRGDPPKGESRFVPHPEGFAHANELVRLVKSEFPELKIGCAAYPDMHPESPDRLTDVRMLRLKQECGADFAVTQLFFRNSDYFGFCELARSEGVTIPIVPGIMPVSSAKQLAKSASLGNSPLPEELQALMAREDDISAEGFEYTLAQCRGLLERGAPGIHFYTLNHSDASARLIAALRESAPGT